MGTRASVKLQTLPGDALLMYTRWDGHKDDIKEWGSSLTEKWIKTVNVVAQEISGKEDAFPVLKQWCEDTREFLSQPETLGGAANLISSASLSHLHAAFSVDVNAKEEGRTAIVQGQLDDHDYCLTPSFSGEAHMRKRSSKKIKPSESGPSLVSIQYEMTYHDRTPTWEEVLYEAKIGSEVDVVKDLLTLPRFFREVSVLTRDNRLKDVEGAEILNSLSDNVRRVGGKSMFDKSPDREKPISKADMVQYAERMLPLGGHLSQLGQHLALLKPGWYQPATAARYLTHPERTVSFKISERGDRMAEADVSVADGREKGFQEDVRKAIQEEDRLRQNSELSALFEGSSHVAVDVKNNQIKIHYMEDVVNVLHTVANVPCRHIADVFERNLLRRRVGEVDTKIGKKPRAL